MPTRPVDHFAHATPFKAKYSSSVPFPEQYSVYIFAGISGVVGALLARRACTRRTSFRPATCVLAVAAAAVLASLGLGFYQVGA